MPQKTSKSKTLPADTIARYFESKLQAEWGPHDLRRRRESNPSSVVVLDVRDKEGYAKEHIKGAVNIPLEELEGRLKELPKDKDIVTYCWTITCSLAPKAGFLLAKKGFRVHELVGGISEWKKYNLPLESSEPTRPTREPAITR